MLVPEGGAGEVWQRSFSLRRVRLALTAGATAAGLLGLALVVQLGTLSRVLDHDALVGENVALKARLAQVDRELAELAPVIQRVRVYDEQLRDLGERGALPGFGAIDEEEVAARDAWIAGVVGVPVDLGGGLGLRAEDLAAELRALSQDGRLDGLDARIAQWEELRQALPSLWPVDGVLTSPFGHRRSPFTRRWKFHGGIDIGAAYGTPIVATADGVVTFAGWASGHGRTVDVDHGSGVSTRYCHASQILVGEGDNVVAGDVVALVGSSGMSTGPHLHYELFVEGERVDPLAWLPSDDGAGF